MVIKKVFCVFVAHEAVFYPECCRHIVHKILNEAIDIFLAK